MDNKEYKQKLIARSYKFSIDIMQLVDNISERSYSINVLSKQIIRSATSIGANIVEAQACSSKKDFTNFLTHSLKSANETKYWLGLLRETNKLNKEKINMLLKEAIELSNLLASSILSLRGRK